jgi:PAS domain S-box-containing protein
VHRRTAALRNPAEALFGGADIGALVLEAIGEAVYAMDRDLRILFASPKALQFWDKPAEQVIGRPLLEVFPGIEAGEPYRAYLRVLSTGAPIHLETTAPALGNRWIGLDVHPAPRGGLVVAFRDIDARKRAEARLRESEEHFRLMLEALPDKAFVIRPDGVAEYYNQQLRDYAGVPIGPYPADRSALHPPEDRDRVDAARARAFATGEEIVVEARMRRYDGDYRWHRIRNRPIRVDGRIAFWLGTAVDINDMREANAYLERRVAERTAELEAANRRLAAQIDEREKAEAQLRHAQRIEVVGQLTSGVAHDFNNLLTAIIGNLELLRRRFGANSPGAHLIDAAEAAADRGARLTAQLLAFSRQQRMRPEPVDLNAIVERMDGLLQSTIGAAIGIERVLVADLWPALADPGQIELVLLNLAINARDALPDRGVVGGVITIETGNATLGPPQRAEEPPPGEYAMVAVSDTGSGIPADIRDRVFDPFFTTKEVGKGSGLGLSQVLGVAQQLGGGVRIETRPGEGTTVRVYLPRARVSMSPGNRFRLRSTTASGEAAERRERLLLLVDDDSDVRRVTATMLTEAGYRVIEAGSAGAALEHLEREGPRVELMIADIAMPGMNGVALAQAARRARPDLAILLVTGFGGPELAAEEFGPDQVLRKPFRGTELAARVAEILNERDQGGVIVRLRSQP